MDPILVSTGRLNKVWKLSTQTGLYALKCVFSKSAYEETDKIANNFKNVGLPVITMHPKGLYLYGMYCFQLFDWIKGKKLTPDKITEKQVEIVGNLLARFHSLSLQSTQLDVTILNNSFHNYTMSYDMDLWVSVLHKAVSLKVNEYNQLKSLSPLLVKIAERSSVSAAQLSSTCVISHRDISPNNVIWKQKDKPIIIDWELAGLIHPTAEVIGAAFDWSIVHPTQIDILRYQRLVQAYVNSGGILNHISLAFEAAMGVWLNWLLYNLRCFVANKDTKIAEREAARTLLTFKAVYNRKEIWLSLLNKELNKE
ncbi:aminoglycoside phosphotransferase family protein [Coxiella endosymbiont of Amblyomma americanum]|uniref:aminoglycoside phosphotransferase family protein n=1 Tax=Coxiella endosymbiont of Amblyomma americanum TaxID=325775 RepID=UPI000689A26E|nr:aminoglycoside phosphotransferase family protein [Coxiella endosymbiont of Amblyomma americanum]